MKVRLVNIQGFRGDYSYEINDLVTVINSKYNGVGKTTLFDCIRFLIDVNSVDKEERKFFKNLKENHALFSVTENGVSNGFYFEDNKEVIFFREEEGEMVTQDFNFPTAAQELGVLVMNGALLNIFDKEVNLFSKSKLTDNYQLVKEITTHKPTEEMLELIERSLEYNKAEVKALRDKHTDVSVKLIHSQYYTHLPELERLINNKNYSGVEDLLSQALTAMREVRVVQPLNLKANILEYLINVNERLANLTLAGTYKLSDQMVTALVGIDSHLSNLVPVGDTIEFNTEALLMVEELATTLTKVEPVVKLEEFAIEPLELLDELTNALINLIPVGEPLKIDTEFIAEIDSLCDSLASLAPVKVMKVNTIILAQLAELSKAVSMVRINQEKSLTAKAEATKLRELLATERVQCPIRQEVYLINGDCNY